MKQQLIVFFFLLGAALFSRAQQVKEIARLVTQKKQTGAMFFPYKPLKENTAQNALRQEATKGVTKFSVLNIDQNQLQMLLSSKPGAFTMRLSTIAEGDMELELVKVDLFTSDFAVTTSDSQVFKAFNNQLHYRGVVKGIDQAITAISVFDSKIMGIISIPNYGNLVLGEMEGNNPAHQHILYNDKDMKDKLPFECKTRDDAVNYKNEDLFNSPTQRGQGASCVRIYVETDFNVFQNRGSIANVNTFVSSLFNQSAMLYQNEGIPMVLSQIAVWTSASPYNQSNSNTYLSSFQSFRNTFNGDLGHLICFNNNMGGLAAGFTGLCNANRDLDQCISALDIPPYNIIPAYSWNVYVFTHEMGHLLGSRHTHACVWNGDNTAIDGCGPAYNPIYQEGSCPVAGIPTRGGTIMSYCHIQTTGINFTLGFGTQPSNIIRNRVFAAPCLNICSPIPAVDLYIQDKTTDNGTEPNPDPTGQSWVSQDIWVRNKNDSSTVHQNPLGNSRNYIYVRVRNRGSAASVAMNDVKLYTYWAWASASPGWPSPWDGSTTGCYSGGGAGIPQVIPAIAAGGSTVLVFEWFAPASCFTDKNFFRFCLLARIETTKYAPFGMTFPETNDLLLNVKNNNNIACRNVSICENELYNLFSVDANRLQEQGVNAFTLGFDFEARRYIPSKTRLVGAPPPPVDTSFVGPVVPLPNPNQFYDPAVIPYYPINVNYNLWDIAYVDVDLGLWYPYWSGTGTDFEILEHTAPSGFPWIRMKNARSSLQKINVGISGIEVIKVRIKQFAGPVGEQDFDIDVTLTNYYPPAQKTGGITFFIVATGVKGPARSSTDATIVSLVNQRTQQVTKRKLFLE